MNNFRGQGADRLKSLQISPLQARILSVAALCSMWGWFLYGILGAPRDPYFIRILLQLVASISGFYVFFSPYGFIALGLREQIDERELQQRNAAYSHVYWYLLAFLCLGHMLGEGIARIPPEIFADFMAVATGSSLILPPTLLAWRDDAS